MASSPSYITKNRLGIYCFQYVIPILRPIIEVKSSKKLFRKSLKTRVRREALKHARLLWLIMDKLSEKYFDDAVAFGKAMELLKKYDSFSGSDWITIEEQFFHQIDQVSELPLLNLALEMRKDQQQAETKLVLNYEAKLKNYENIIESSNSLKLPIEAIKPVINSPQLSYLAKKWLDTKKQSGLKPESINSVQQRLAIFLQIVNEIAKCEIYISEFSLEIARNSYECLRKIPPNRNSKKLANKSFLELSALGFNPLSNKTYSEYINVITEFLTWACNDGYDVDQKIISMLTNTKPKGKITKKDTIKALPFNDSDLSLIFYSDIYKFGQAKRSSDYWVPLIALFTGARLAEICQLYLKDIRKEDGVWVFDINEDKDDDEQKSIKNQDASKRLVPIHSDLINLGLLDYKDYLLHANQKRLFPDEKRNSSGKYDAFSKRFCQRLNNLGLKQLISKKERKSFHSFRHTVRTKLVDLNIQEEVIDSLIGHTSTNKSTGHLTYTHTNRILNKTKAIKKLNYQLNFQIYSKWNETQFIKLEKRKSLNIPINTT